MSYRSDVRIRLLKDDYAELEKQYLDKFENDEYDIEFWKDKDIYKEEKDSNTIYFGWDGVKWYRNIEDDAFKFVDFIMDYILDLKNYSYAIIGEEIGDIDIDCDGDVDCIEIERKFADE